jgi:sporulation protein YlmC with PRC-barrel domain
MRISQLIGKGVLDKNANTVGNVADFDIDTSSWTVTALVVKSGMLKKVNIGVDRIEKIGDKIFLKVAKEEIEG